MKRERRQRVEKLYRSALMLEPSQRRQFIARACESDDELLREVERLLAGDGPAPPFASARETAADESTVADTGPTEPRNFGPYEILEQLGRILSARWQL